MKQEHAPQHQGLPFVISCEHAVNTVPPNYQPLFEKESALLNTHRGIDFGALDSAKALSKALHAPLIQAQATRLLIDCNRSLSNPACFSSITKPLSKTLRQDIIDTWYRPYRKQVMEHLEKMIAHYGVVIHLSMHSFTPVLHGEIRKGDLSFLYDPKRSGERKIVQSLLSAMKEQAPHFHVRRNYPYKGISDGLTSALRKQWSDAQYIGIEIEFNQGKLEQFEAMRHCLIQALLQLQL